jgi:hypothetical protein
MYIKRKKIKATAFWGVVLFSIAAIILYQHWFVRASFVQVPVSFSFANTPLIDVSIDGKVHVLELDLGSKFFLTLDRESLASIDKEPAGTVQWRDVKGNPHESPSYNIPEIAIDELQWKNIVARETTSASKAAALLWSDKKQVTWKQEVGKIGRPLLERTNICLNFPKQCIVFSDSLHTIQEEGIFPNVVTRVPFHLIRGTMVIEIGTDFGKFHFAIDSGATVSLVKTSVLENPMLKKDERGMHFVSTGSFILGGKNFGIFNLYPFQLGAGIQEIDGILGMDFLKNQVLYIDYPNKIFYIGDK